VIGKLAGSGKIITWGDDRKSITITFLNDKAVTASIIGIDARCDNYPSPPQA